MSTNELKFNCEGIGRRNFVQLGVGTVLGCGMVDLMRLRSAAATAAGKVSPDEVRCLLLWLDGGPTQLETFDPKPNAPLEIRGEGMAINTSVPGIYYSNFLPKLAQLADKVTIVRSICHDDPNHGGGTHYLQTGTASPFPTSCGSRISFHPSIGSVVSHFRSGRSDLPAYMSLPNQNRSSGSNFLGPQCAPFVISGDPNKSDFQVRDMVLPPEVSEGRAQTRHALRGVIDQMRRCHDTLAEDPAVSFDTHYERACETLSSPQAQRAFDISQEPVKVREMYGRTSLGQRLLLCRRLIEVGVPFVTCNSAGWDHHGQIFSTLKGTLVPGQSNAGSATAFELDQSLSALLTDLDQRGLLETTLVLALGEFGRGPKLTSTGPNGGRNHWPHAMSVLMAGAGVPRGHVIGGTDKHAAHADRDVYCPEDFAATVYAKMGIDPGSELHTPDGRPVPIVGGANRARATKKGQGGQIIQGVF